MVPKREESWLKKIIRRYQGTQNMYHPRTTEFNSCRGFEFVGKAEEIEKFNART